MKLLLSVPSRVRTTVMRPFSSGVCTSAQASAVVSHAVAMLATQAPGMSCQASATLEMQRLQ